ncbi:MAG TPA: aminotransferase class III-fold pyridoxal phosphate-dependent enzyme, partial [Thermoanaerobaculia bacterium]
MPQDLKAAREESASVLELIGKKSLSPAEQKRVTADAVRYWTDHVNAGFLEYRKSVSTDYTAVEWEDEGAVFRDVQGREFIDCLGGFGIYVVGHRHPKVLKAVREQLDRQAIHSQELIDPLRTYLAHLLALVTPGDLQFAFLTNSGTESVEGCLKMAMLTTGRHHFVGAIGAFHGKSLGSLGGTSKAMFREPFLPLQHWTHVPFGDADALRSVVASADFTGERVAAVVLEPIQGEGGINVAPPGYLAAAREICDKYGAMLVFDEVQSGMGRSGKMFCCEHDGVVPDLMALGKGFGGGVMPIGCAVGTPKTWEKYIDNPFLHTTTFGGNPVCC